MAAYYDSVKVKGMGVVKVGLVFGLIQALFTIPFGGGYAILIYPAGFFGGLGLLLVILLNPLSQRVKIGTAIGCALFFLAIVLAWWQGRMFDNLTFISPESLPGETFEEQKARLIGELGQSMSAVSYGIILLAVSTGLLAIANSIPHLSGTALNKNLMILPLSIAILAMLIATVLTMQALGDWNSILDDLQAAKSSADLNALEQRLNEFTVLDFILGSRLGGLLNTIALLVGLLLSFSVKLPLEPAASPTGYSQPPGWSGQPYGQGYGALPTGPSAPGSAAGHHQGYRQAGAPRLNDLLGSQPYSATPEAPQPPPSAPGYAPQPPPPDEPIFPMVRPEGPQPAAPPPAEQLPPPQPLPPSPQPQAPTPPPPAEVVTIECPGCRARMDIPKLGRNQLVRCEACGLEGQVNA